MQLPYTATRHIYAGLGYDLFTFCGRFRFEWPKHAEILLKMLYVDDESQIVKAVTPDVCPPSRYWKMFRMARSGLGILTDQEIESVRKALPHRRDWHNIEKGLTQAEIAAILDYEDRTVRNALKACWNYLDTGDRMKAAAAIGLSLPVLAQAIGNKKRKNISP
jgi:hypothetical protein